MRQKVTAEDLAEILTYPFADVFGSSANRGGVFYLSEHPKDFLTFCPQGPSRGMRLEKWAKSAHETVQYMIDQYNEAMQKAKTSDEKILAITRLGKMIDTMHPFLDGNIRTVVLLMNKLLVENGLSPTCMPEPNNLDCKTSEWNVKYEVKRGQETFRKITSQEFSSVHNLKKINDFLERLRAYLDEEKPKNSLFKFFEAQNEDGACSIIRWMQDVSLHLNDATLVQQCIDKIDSELQKTNNPIFKAASFDERKLKSFYLEAKTILEEIKAHLSKADEQKPTVGM